MGTIKMSLLFLYISPIRSNRHPLMYTTCRVKACVNQKSYCSHSFLDECIPRAPIGSSETCLRNLNLGNQYRIASVATG